MKVKQIRKNPLKLLSNMSLILLIFFVLILSLMLLNSTITKANNVVSKLRIGNAPPIVNTTINDGNETFDLTAGTNTTIYCQANITDYNGYADIINVSAYFFDLNEAYAQSPDDNNNHYTRSNCTLYDGNNYNINADCSVNVTYYANNATWTCEVTAYDGNATWSSSNNTILINSLIALNVPATIDYGVVDAFNASLENETNVTNYGNVQIDVQLDGYGYVDGDGLAMNCTQGAQGVNGMNNISLYYEKYNVTESSPDTTGDFSNLSFFELYYLNLTDSPVTEDMDVPQRQSDTYDDTHRSTFWRIYVPEGVAGTCEGVVVFTAVAG